MVGVRKAALAEESAEVEVLFANMEKMRGLTKKIQASLNRLETSGKSVQEAIGPIYGNTQKLQTTNANVDKIIEAIDRMRQPLDQRGREERIINAGPRKAGLPDFVASLDRTTQALGDLKHSNLRSNQQAMADLNSLLKKGTKQLEDAFRELLREEARPVEPLHYLTKRLSFPTLPQESVSSIRVINSHMAASAAQMSEDDAREATSTKIYAEIRGEYINNSTRNLAAACMNTARKTTAGAMYRPGTNGIGTYASGLEGLFIAEYENICPIFARDDWAGIYLQTCQMALNDFAKTLRELNNHVKNNLSTDCLLAYEIIGIASKLSANLEQRTGELKRPIADSVKPIRETAKMSLRTLLDETRNKVATLIAIPIDGGASNTTTDMMTRLQQMTHYIDPLSSVLISLGDVSWSSAFASSSSSSTSLSKPFDVGADGRQLFAHYAMEMIETQLRELDVKGRTLHKGRALQGVFIANNVAIIDRMVQTSDLSQLLPGVGSAIESWRKRATQMYLDAWKEPSGCLFDVLYTGSNRGGRPHSGGATGDSLKGMSSKSKDSVKEKWKNFNASFDDLIIKHKSYAMEKEVSVRLAREVQIMIEPLYGRFWDRYHEIDKGKGKYVKYDKQQLAAMLASLV